MLRTPSGAAQLTQHPDHTPPMGGAFKLLQEGVFLQQKNSVNHFCCQTERTYPWELPASWLDTAKDTQMAQALNTQQELQAPLAEWAELILGTRGLCRRAQVWGPACPWGTGQNSTAQSWPCSGSPTRGSPAPWSTMGSRSGSHWKQNLFPSACGSHFM